MVHGGPGALGSVAAVARELAKDTGVVEPLQTETTLNGQIEELQQLLREHTKQPVTLIGHSWGAWLAYLVAAKYPDLVAKLILVSSPAFRSEYVTHLSETRLSRLSPVERAEYQQILVDLHSPDTDGKDDKILRLGELVGKADEYCPMVIDTEQTDMVKVDGNMYSSVWNEAAQLRTSGQLLEYAKDLRCPVVAIHGDYDPSPALGVRDPLMSIIANFKFILLEKCGHSPWKERYAHEQFYEAIREEIIST